MEKRNIISAYSSLDNARQNMKMKSFAKEVLLEENYEKFIKSYKFMFWFQLIGILAGFLIPSVIMFIISRNMSYVAFGVAFGILSWILGNVTRIPRHELPQTLDFSDFLPLFT